MTRYLTRRNDGHRHSVFLPEFGEVVTGEGEVGEHPGLSSHVSLGLSAAHSHTHNHDEAYAPTHAHPYAADSHSHSHNHDGSYSAQGHLHTTTDIGAADAVHTHDTTHDHDADYAPVHSHPYSDTSHNHDAAYSAAAHTHTLSDGDVPAGIARDTEVSAAITAHLSAATHGSEGGFEFPVGFIFIAAVSTNPATLLGYGTWTAFGSGRVLVGIDAGQTEFDTLLETGGAKTHTLTAAEMPAHVHNQSRLPTSTGGTVGHTVDTSMSGTPTTTGVDTGSAGGGGAHNNLQPYIVVHMWQRTA